MRIIQQAETRKQESAQAIPESFGFKAATRYRPGVKECDLKKQSQFAQGIIRAKSFMKGDYGIKPVHIAEENKANYTHPH